MINPKKFLDILIHKDITFFTGVPDSLLKDFISVIDTENHIIAANEGSAIGLATGSYLATGKIPLVYMQNSGLGNTINPLLSLTDSSVYGIPMILLVGWRGEPNIYDEPQHIKQGSITEDLLKSIQIPYFVLDKTVKNLENFINKVLEKTKLNTPVVILVKKNTFETYEVSKNITNGITQVDAVSTIINNINNETIIVSTTGYTSRILDEIRPNYEKNFYVVGSMGHVNQIALGISYHLSDELVICLDGDGSVLMHMGSLATVGNISKNKYLHIVLNNSCHASVGGQNTTNPNIDFCSIARGCGYRSVNSVSDDKSLINFLNKEFAYPSFLEIKINNTVPAYLSRPSSNLIERKNIFMNYLKKCNEFI